MILDCLICILIRCKKNHVIKSAKVWFASWLFWRISWFLHAPITAWGRSIQANMPSSDEDKGQSVNGDMNEPAGAFTFFFCRIKQAYFFLFAVGFVFVALLCPQISTLSAYCDWVVGAFIPQVRINSKFITWLTRSTNLHHVKQQLVIEALIVVWSDPDLQSSSADPTPFQLFWM